MCDVRDIFEETANQSFMFVFRLFKDYASSLLDLKLRQYSLVHTSFEHKISYPAQPFFFVRTQSGVTIFRYQKCKQPIRSNES